ncbi:hypothetical protein [uncultured Draconibacterium sp.]|uniref:hypothetical protein n=1 Tax=uncultured Draconibacterium sp. TaxID=1573823 RepID=UPI0029C61F01|nr:hypothetical protein [uncultured Draconibacterium sp.]
MKTFTLLLILLSLSTFLSAQNTADTIRDYSIQIKGTDVPVKGFEIRKPETAFDLALNISYLHHVSEDRREKCLVLPVVTIDNKPVFEAQLKQLSMNDVKDYKFEAGILPRALFGASGQYGHLEIKKGRRLELPVIKE